MASKDGSQDVGNNLEAKADVEDRRTKEGAAEVVTETSKETTEEKEAFEVNHAETEVSEETIASEAKRTDVEPLADGQRSKRVYVGNLTFSVSWQDLKDHMKSTGLDVTKANVMSGPDGRSKGCGIVEFATVEAAQQAVLTLNDTELKGRQIFVREDREIKSGSGNFQIGAASAGGQRFSSEEHAQNRRVYVGNLSWSVAWQSLKDHMRQAGEVVHAEVIMEYNGRSKGCGIVEYATDEEAQEAIKTLTDTELNGRMIFVREDRETPNQGASYQGTYERTQSTSVYVWNLAPGTSWQDLKDHMRMAGNVDSATVMTNADSLCCGVVVYQRPQEAERAIRELQGTDLNGSAISIREDRKQVNRGAGSGRGFGGRGRGGRGISSYGGGRGIGRVNVDAETQLFVGNLAQSTTWRELKDHFRQCGDIQRAEVKNGPAGQSKGFGTVQFLKKSDAKDAITQLNGSELQGNVIEVRLDQKAR